MNFKFLNHAVIFIFFKQLQISLLANVFLTFFSPYLLCSRIKMNCRHLHEQFFIIYFVSPKCNYANNRYVFPNEL